MILKSLKENLLIDQKFKKARIDHIVNKLEKHDEKIDKLHGKLCDSTKISTMKRLRDKAKEYMIKAKRYKTEILHILNISNTLCTDTNVDTDVDTNADTNVDTDVRTNVDTDADTNVDTNVDTNIDTNVDTNVDINNSNDSDDDDDDVITNLRVGYFGLSKEERIARLSKTFTSDTIKAIRHKDTNQCCLEKIEESAHALDDMHYSLIHTLSDLKRNLHYIDKQYETLKINSNAYDKISELQDNSYDMVWKLAYDESDSEKKSYSHHLTHFIGCIKNLMLHMESGLKPLTSKICKMKQISEKGINSMDEAFTIFTNTAKERLSEIINNCKNVHPDTFRTIKHAIYPSIKEVMSRIIKNFNDKNSDNLVLNELKRYVINIEDLYDATCDAIIDIDSMRISELQKNGKRCVKNKVFVEYHGKYIHELRNLIKS